ncbi:MAG TPA: Gfo/Idh/MocA family oxidoreductase [Armatimonadota bacterium]|nr:Gfo/Idh/MocA family oxidoreductase [Armatimonadota bacterium]
MGISIGMVGLGQFGVAFADMFMSHPLVDRIALCDREPERVARFAEKELWQAKLSQNDLYPSLDDILESDLDALVIITQPWLHAAQCARAMVSGMHVYSAVPIVSLPDGDLILDWCDRIVEISERTGMKYMLGETTYYRPQTMFCRKKAAEGMFGDFVYAEGEYFHDVDSPGCNLRNVQVARTSSAAGQEWLERAKSYRDRGVESGPMHYPTHSTSGPVSVMNAHALKVTGYGYRNQNDDSFFGGDISNETALFEMSNGATVRICEFRECAGELGHDGETFRIMGSKGTFRENQWICNHRDEPPADMERFERVVLRDADMFDPLPPEVGAAFKSALGVEGDGDFVPSGHGGSHPYLVHEFVEAVAQNRQPAINAWEAARYMAMGVMAHKSALKDGERLDVPDWGDAPS